MERPWTHDLRQGLFDDATAVMRVRYGEDLSVEDVARAIATSRRHLQRVLREVGNTTFRDYLTAVRMDVAAELLDGRPVRQVASLVGYRQPGQFAKAFRRHHGISPTEHRTACGGPARIRVAA